MGKKHHDLDALVPALYDRWMQGERYPSLAREAGVPIGTLRHRFVTRARGLDGKDGYRKAVALRDQQHPLPKTGPQRSEQERPDDSEVPVFTSTPIEEGWYTRRENVLDNFTGEDLRKVGSPFEVVIAPDCSEYVTAGEFEAAEFILAYPDLAPWRLKAYHADNGEPKRHTKPKSILSRDVQRLLGV